MKVSFIIQDLFFRGAQYATAMIANGFASKGYEVEVLVSKVHDDFISQGQVPFRLNSQIRLIQLSHRRARHNVGEIRKYLKHTDSMAVIAMDSNYENALALASLGLWKRPRLYTVEHGIRFSLNRDLKPLKSYSFFSKERWRRKFVYSRMDGVFTVCMGVAEELRRLFGVARHKLHVVYNPVVDCNYLPKLNLDPEHPWLKTKDVPTFILAGQLEEYKGVDLAIRAVHALSKMRKVRLIAFGDGAARSEYEKYIKDNNLEEIISLPGYTSKLPSELRHSDGYVCTSRMESFGITVVEALVANVPVVSVNVPSNGPPEILKGGKFGRLVPFGDVDAIVQALDDICTGKLKPAGDVAWSRFKCEAVVERYEMGISNVEVLEPYRFDNVQFFRQWVAEAWSQLGGSVRSDMWMPWRVKFFLDKIGAAFSLPFWMKNGRKLILTSGGNPGYLSVPAGYRYEIIPMVWDCWEKYWPYLIRFIRKNKVRLVFCTSSQTAQHVREVLPTCKAVWVPEGIKNDLYPKGPSLAYRKIDVLEMGRCMGEIHTAIIKGNKESIKIRHLYQKGRARLFPNFDSLTEGLRDAKMVVCFPRCDTHPELAGRVETMTQRYWECMLSGSLMIGRAPKELIDFCGYNPVITLGDDPVGQIQEIINNISDYQGLADKNRKTAEQLGDWSSRIPLIFEAVKEINYE